jgi:DNA polymerase V
VKRPIFALIDCNNFFVSCEKLFRPDLEGKPVVVMSSNDGCVVARSNEAKALGIPMGAPVFKYRHVFERQGVVRFSANFELYGDVSRRIVEALTTVTPRIEIYSVDESFLDLSELALSDYAEWGTVVRQRLCEWTGIPVSVGIAPSKTLAKLASTRAKKRPELNGILSLMDDADRQPHMEATSVDDLWGIGWRLAPKIRAEGITNAHQLSVLRPGLAKQLMGIQGRRLVAELNGISCYPLENDHIGQQSIARTRTFGQDTSDFYSIEAALANFAARAAFTLRRSRQLAKRLGIFLTTNKHKPGYRRWSREIELDMPTADSGLLISQAARLLKELYGPGIEYHRAGVCLYDLTTAKQLQIDLLGTVDVSSHLTAQSRMEAIDKLNERFGRQTIRYAAEVLGSQWEPKNSSTSPRYTTRLEELPVVRAAFRVPAQVNRAQLDKEP